MEQMVSNAFCTTRRPGQTQEEFRAERRHYNKAIKAHKRGHMAHVSHALIEVKGEKRIVGVTFRRENREDNGK